MYKSGLSRIWNQAFRHSEQNESNETNDNTKQYKALVEKQCNQVFFVYHEKDFQKLVFQNSFDNYKNDTSTSFSQAYSEKTIS